MMTAKWKETIGKAVATLLFSTAAQQRWRTRRNAGKKGGGRQRKGLKGRKKRETQHDEGMYSFKDEIHMEEGNMENKRNGQDTATHTDTHTQTHAQTHTQTHTQTHAQTHTQTHTQTNTHRR